MHFDITAIAFVILVALFFGAAMSFMRQPPIIGYIVAGFILGPSFMGIVDSRHEIHIIAELGIVMLLFVIGMELPLEGFRKIWKRSCVICAAQIILALAVTWALSFAFAWAWPKAVLFGFIAALSSTALAIKLSESHNPFPASFLTALVGILIAQDIAFVPMMLIIDNIAEAFSMIAVLQVVGAIAIVSLLLATLSRHKVISLPFTIRRNRREMALMIGIGLCLASATVSGVIGLSPAYGAFLAGLVLAHSKKRDVILNNVRPVSNLLIMGFFLSVGLRIDLGTISQHWHSVLFFLILILIGKTFINAFILRLAGDTWPRALGLSLALAQIGEFSFLLAQSGFEAGILQSQEYSLVIIIASLSLIVTSLSMPLIEKVRKIPPESSLSATLSHIDAGHFICRKIPAKIKHWHDEIRDMLVPK